MSDNTSWSKHRVLNLFNKTKCTEIRKRSALKVHSNSECGIGSVRTEGALGRDESSRGEGHPCSDSNWSDLVADKKEHKPE